MGHRFGSLITFALWAADAGPQHREDVPVGLGTAASAHALAARGSAAESLGTDGVFQGNSAETMTMAE